MNTQLMKLKFRDAINKVTGKAAIADRYANLNMEMAQLISEMHVGPHANTKFVKEVIDEYNSITESGLHPKSSKIAGAIDLSNDYDARKGSKVKTQKKIQELEALIRKVREARIVSQDKIKEIESFVLKFRGSQAAR